MDDMKIWVVDCGDLSVGLTPVTTLTAVLDGNFAGHLAENGLTEKFKKRLLDLVNEFYEPETVYAVEASTDKPED